MLFKRVYCLEKIHGTSAHITIDPQESVISYFTGDNYEHFKSLFNEKEILSRMGNKPRLTVYGEHYGGKIQGQSHRYGTNKKFVAFDVQIGGHWLDVERAEKIVLDLGLEFVHYTECAAMLESVDYWRDYHSVQSWRNGGITLQTREGIVIRPPIEMIMNNGERVIAKHKRPEFSETKTHREVNEHPEKQASFDIAEEWVTQNRLLNILSHHHYDKIEDTPKIVIAMIEDVLREGDFEVQDTRENRKAIGSAAAKLFRQHLIDKARRQME